jgi:regulator of replication initiation timing
MGMSADWTVSIIYRMSPITKPVEYLDGQQMHAMQQNAAMLSTTVADLNAKRDLLVQENGHLRERLDQESALRQAMTTT